MSKGYDEEDQEIAYLQIELQQQRGMLWLLGEIMKAAVNITEFKQLMAVLTDMLMGVMGVTTCYLWIKTEQSKESYYTVFLRSIELKNEFTEIKYGKLPRALGELKESYVFATEEIKEPVHSEISVPSSRLGVPLRDFNDNEVFGVLVLEHEEADFFTANTIAFFETLSIFIASNAINSKLLQSVAEESIRDPLTETYNRRYLNIALHKAKKKHKDVTVAVIDTDNFKSINDELGHMEGDAVLKGIAHLAKGIVEECKGEVIRYGGDEFVIILPKPLAEAVNILEEFRKSVHYLKVAYDLATNVSITLGVCSYPEMTSDYNQLLKAADNALLRGKGKGKNRVVLACDEDLVLGNVL